MDPLSEDSSGVFDLHEQAALLPDSASTMLVDRYLTDRASASSRVFRIYRDLPLHYHNDCEEYLYVLSGSGTFHLDGTESEVRPGLFLCFQRRTVHGFPRIGTDEPLIVLSIDVPRRRPDDIVFVDPESGDAGSFMQRNNP